MLLSGKAGWANPVTAAWSLSIRRIVGNQLAPTLAERSETRKVTVSIGQQPGAAAKVRANPEMCADPGEPCVDVTLAPLTWVLEAQLGVTDDVSSLVILGVAARSIENPLLTRLCSRRSYSFLEVTPAVTSDGGQAVQNGQIALVPRSIANLFRNDPGTDSPVLSLEFG